MTTEEKDLLRKDLCARFPYGVIVSVTDGAIKYEAYIEFVSYRYIQVSPVSDSNFTAYTYYKISEIKPYLRPMSSMTEEERKEYEILANHCIVTSIGFIHLEATPLTDWLNKNMFDHRGLIPKGLALEATKDMYNDKIKEK